MIEARTPTRRRDFGLHDCITTALGPTHCPMHRVLGGSFQGVGATGV
jgi:hypothetical protein